MDSPSLRWTSPPPAPNLPTLSEVEGKVCTGCSEFKSIDQFGIKNGKPGTRCRTCINAYHRNRWMKTEAYEKHKARVRDRNRRLQWEQYGLTEEEYKSIPIHTCECCGLKPAAVPDHCHETGVLRGFVCYGCNVGIGQLGDNLDGVLRAVAYLERTQFGRV